MSTCGTFAPARISDLPSIKGSISALLATPSFIKALMTDRPVPITALPGDFIAPDDEGLFEFISSLRRSVRAKVALGQERGMSLADIVVEVREMVRFAEEDPTLPRPLPTQAYRAISREAVAWCIEAYQPIAFTAGHRFVPDALAVNPKSALQLLDTTSEIAQGASAQSPIK